ncbi:ubiquitin-associated protein 2-like isoform X5 [Asterias rubens]|uniref:ubiquitin-associated protein 2-like isoform X5 n=1 Tax=Asterias rubens TaxID=7604 RepID=UPI0014556871|nr:ubiquitin-associated protein 2-like isoform X5 [Asterias rubens]
MMSSMGSTRGNTRSGARERPVAKSSSQTSTSKSGAGDTPVGKKATPDQIRLAQMISDSTSINKLDDKLAEKIKMVQDVTHKSEDEIMVALYDCQEDTERAINLLLERVDGDQGEWETISSKKKVKSNTSTSRGSNSNSDNTSNSREGRSEKEGGGREKGGKDKEPRDRDNKERDGNYRGRGRGGRAQLPPRMTKGRGRESDSSSRDRERNDQNNKWEGGESGRGRGRKAHDQTNGPSRRGGRGPRSYTNPKFGTFEQNDAFKPGDNVWTNPPDTSNDNNMGDFTVSAWDGSAIATDSWTADDWSGDLAESKVFTPSPGQTSEIPNNSVQQPSAQPQQSPLSTNAQMPPSMPATMSVSSMAPSMGQSLAVQSSSMGQPQSMAATMQQQSSVMPSMQQRDVINSYSMEDSHTSSAPENFTRIDLAALFGKSTPHASNVTSQLTSGAPASMSDPMSSQRQSSNVFSQYGEIKPQPPISANDNKVNQMGMPPGQGVPGQEASANQQAQQRAQSQQASKPTKKRMPPPSTKIPLSAVEMPVSARGLGVLDVQFGAMDLEPSVDFGVSSMMAGVPPSSTSLQGSVPMPSSGQLPSAMPSYSMGESAAVTAPSHLSNYPNKQGDNYPSSAMNTLLTASTASPIPTTLEQRSIYGQAPQKQMAPEPIPMPNQNQVGFMNAQKASPTQQMDGKTDKLQSGPYHTPSMPLQLSSLGTHPTSLASNAMSQSPSGMQASTGLHSQMGLASHGNQQMRQTQNSYHPTSATAMTTTVHSQVSLPSGLSNMPHGYSGSNMNASSHPNSGMGANNLAQSNLGGSNLGTSNLGSSSLGGSALNSSSLGGSGHQTSGLSSHSTSGLSSSGGLTAGGLSSGPSTMSTQPSGLSSSVSGMSSSGHMTGTTVSNSMPSQSGAQVAQLSSNKLGGLDGRLNSSQHGMDHSHPTSSSLNSHSSMTSNASTSSLTTSSYNTVSGMSSGLTSVTSVGSSAFKSSLTSNKGPPNLPPGMPLFNPQYIMGHGILPVNPFQAAAAASHQSFYNYDDLQMQLSRMPIGYSYDPQQFPQPPTTMTGRDVTSHSTAQYSMTDQSKFTRGEAASPVGSSLSTQQQQQQQQTGQAGHHQTQQQATQQAAFMNPATVPPGYGYGGLPYYPSHGIIPPGLQYQPAVFPAVNTVQPNNRSQAGTTPHSAFQQTAYGQHGSHSAYGAGYDDLNQSQDYTKGGYSTVSQSGAKGTGATGRSSVSVTSASAVPADMTASSYTNKAHSQSYADKQGFHTGTPPPFNFPLASGNQGGPLTQATGYPHASFVPMMPHNTMLPHQLHSDGQGGSSQRSQGSTNPGKPVSKPPYGGSTYWGAN